MAERQRNATVAVAWDQTSRSAYSLVAFLASSSSADVGFEVPGFERSASNLLDDLIVPTFSTADRVLAVWSTNDPLWVGFQTGLAVGLGRPVRVVAFDAEVSTPRDIVGGVTVIGRPEEARVIGAGEFPPVPPVDFAAGRILLCPQETPNDRLLLELLTVRLGDRQYRQLDSQFSSEPAVNDVVWVITGHEVSGRNELNLAPNLLAAYEAGRCYGATLRSGQSPQLRIIRVGVVPPISALEHLTQAAPDAAAAADLVGAPASAALRVTRVVLRDLKCFTSIEVPISVESPLGGAWTCIAGINGAGKSTVLQSISLALLGRKSAPELGLARLARMVRRPDGQQKPPPPACEIRLTLSDGSSVGDVVLPLSESGIDERRLAAITDRSTMEQLWERLRSTLVVAYGATRNISDTPGGSSSTPMSPIAHRQLTLFDPLAQIVSTEALVAGGPRFEPILRTIAMLVTALLDEPDAPFRCEVVDGRLIFSREGATLSTLDLPDGFRSVLALLADIASGWHELHPDSGDVPVAAADIEGIVLVDELDLHLHARLQRLIVPRLRKTLSNMQWIVTTHSPFIVGSFDQREIVLLDREEPTGIRELDRQILAFTANDIYDWLLDARPVSEVGESESSTPDGTALLYQSPDRNEAQAQQLVAKQDELLAQLRSVQA